jgi:hypothetical protein
MRLRWPEGMQGLLADVHVNPILGVGLACIIAAIVGGGLKALGVEIPALASVWRQWLLGSLGVLLVLFARPSPSQQGGGSSVPSPPVSGANRATSDIQPAQSQPALVPGSVVNAPARREQQPAVAGSSAPAAPPTEQSKSTPEQGTLSPLLIEFGSEFFDEDGRLIYRVYIDDDPTLVILGHAHTWIKPGINSFRFGSYSNEKQSDARLFHIRSYQACTGLFTFVGKSGSPMYAHLTSNDENETLENCRIDTTP